MQNKMINFPTALTLIRLLVSPLIMPILIAQLIPYHKISLDYFLASIFIILGMTDFIDGYVARCWKQESLLGKLLDPIADKFLLFSSLIALVSIKRVSYIFTIIFIGREFFVVGIREVCSAHYMRIPVSFLAKTKTLLQYAYITVVILNSSQDAIPYGNVVETVALTLALLTSLSSAWLYYKKSLDLLYNVIPKEVEIAEKNIKI